MIVTVYDHGPGVADAGKHHIFEPFWRAGARRGGGAGLGLATVRETALRHGGQIQIEDAPRGGTGIWHILPPPHPHHEADFTGKVESYQRPLRVTCGDGEKESVLF